MILKKSLLSVALLASISSAAMADFSGFYVGPQLSYTWNKTATQVKPDNVYSTTTYSDSTPSDGFTINPHVGWAFQKDSWVYAIEGSYNSGSFTDREKASADGFNTSFQEQVSEVYTLTPLIGYTQDNWLFYGKAGYISGKVEVDSAAHFSGYDLYLSDSQRQYGWTAGAGVAYEFNEKQSIGLEYDYARLGSTDFNLTTTGSAAIPVKITAQNINMNTLALVYSYHFG